MSTPIWITNPGFLSTVTELVSTTTQVVATGTNIRYSLISGQLPNGLAINSSTGIISGTPTVVYSIGLKQFVIRARNNDGVSDRTFNISVYGPTPPQWNAQSLAISNLTNEIISTSTLGFTNFIYDIAKNPEPIVVNKQYIDFQLTAEVDILPPGKNLYYYIADDNGQLPPGVTLTSDGRIFGFVNDSTILNYTYSDNGKFDDESYGSVPYDYAALRSTTGAKYYDKVYKFYVTATDGIAESKYLFKIEVVDPAFLTTLDEQPSNSTVISYTRYPVPPQWLMDTDLGVIRSNNKHVFKLSAYDPYPGYGPLRYNVISAVPDNFTFNTSTGILLADIPYSSTFNTTATISISATKVLQSIPVTTTTTNATFSISILGDNAKYIEFITPTVVGTLRPGEISMLQFSVARKDGLGTTYRLISGSLPDNLYLETDGSIVGKIAYDLTTSTSYIFTVRAEDVQREAYVEKTFNLLVDRSVSTIFTNIYLSPYLPDAERDIYSDFVTDTNIFPQYMIYRPLDLNFGVQRKLKLPLVGGIEAVDSRYYALAMTRSFYNKQLQFGEIKVAVAATRDNTIIYEIVYVEVNDDLVNFQGESVPPEVTSFDTVMYPNSIANMRGELSDIQIDGVNIIRNEYYIPLYRKTVQDTSGGSINLANIIPICYANPGSGTLILKKINNSGFNFNVLKCEIDRIIIENTLDNKIDKYLIFPKRTIND
jgi:hypothetical protein